jgi:hypothetical protein
MYRSGCVPFGLSLKHVEAEEKSERGKRKCVRIGEKHNILRENKTFFHFEGSQAVPTRPGRDIY